MDCEICIDEKNYKNSFVERPNIDIHTVFDESSNGWKLSGPGKWRPFVLKEQLPISWKGEKTVVITVCYGKKIERWTLLDASIRDQSILDFENLKYDLLNETKVK